MPKEKSDGSERPEKPLQNAHVSLTRAHQRNTIHNIILTWRVANYEQLKCNVLYFQLYDGEDVQCALRLLKKDKSLFLCVSGASIPKNTKAEFMILSETSTASVINSADELDEGYIFATEFSSETFLGPEKNFLRDGTLTVGFKYASDQYTTYQESQLEEHEVLSDMDELCCDLKYMYYESIFSDFLIHAQEYSFKTHKFILASRSSYFDSLFENDKSLGEHRLDVLPGILHEVLVYMYCGEIKDMDLECTLRVFELAHLLKLGE